MANKDLFKQAIAEAKSIREAAIANAKEALEESLTPHLKDMLAAKLQEMEDSKVEEEVVNEVEEEVEEAVDTAVEESEGVEEAMHSDDDDKMEESDVVEAEDDSEESEDEAEGDEEVEAEEEDEDIEVKDMEVDDLKNLIRDIIAQEMGDGGEEELDGVDMDAGAEMEPAMDDMEVGAEDDEIDLDELLAELESATNEEIEEEVTEEVEEEVKEDVVNEESELTEALATIETLQSQLQEVNLLNAKLMYVNKVFKANNLSESQKVNIIAAFDKAETVKEVKLVFETVSENVVSKKATKVNESKLGMASKPTGTTAAKPEVISEVSDAVKRMQKLAGII
jgi:hypothetical protein